ncbi:LysR family transcriptional regulator [Parachitinimonas caeni]|uniref:LysR family transcriptional regulator n=1 Tax=Parachitinimonas caeni TaxID=3031301 RepID=A0ABT7E033_9NEIS|nr:LysR family transcriptional regulator [Parachitinimonas caeni]MDK2125439.1 LysR family transcriptional regulator [Parachitinimonas caeni]
MLNPLWLRSFSVLVELGSFTRCAEQLDLTQAAVSQHIQKLEERLGPLLIRRPRQIELTPAGRVLLDYCKEVSAADLRLQNRLSALDELLGEVGLICPGSIGLMVFPLLLDLQQGNPGLVIRQRFAPDWEVLEAVLDNRFELGLTTIKPDDPRLSTHRFAEEPLELIVPAAEQVDSYDDLLRIGFIDHPDGRAMANRLLSRYYPDTPGISKLPCRGFINQIGLILEPVARGLGCTVLPRYARQAFSRPEAIKVIEGPVVVMDTLWLLHRSEWPLTARAERIIQQLRSHLQRI